MTPPHTAASTTSARSTPPSTTLATRAPERDAVRPALQRAAARIAPLWPLDRFVAVNPYLGLTDHRFEEASQLLARTTGAATTMAPSAYRRALADGVITSEDVAASLVATSGRATAADVDALLERVARASDELTARVPTVADVATSVTGRDWRTVATERVADWAAAYFDAGQAVWRSADRGLAPFAAWLEEARVDRTPDVLGLRGFRRVVGELPEDHLAAAASALASLEVPEALLDDYLDGVLRRLGGWAAHAAWLGWEAGLRGEQDDTLEQLLAVLLCWEAGLLATTGLDVEAAWQHARTTTADPAGCTAARRSAWRTTSARCCI